MHYVTFELCQIIILQGSYSEQRNMFYYLHMTYNMFCGWEVKSNIWELLPNGMTPAGEFFRPRILLDVFFSLAEVFFERPKNLKEKAYAVYFETASPLIFHRHWKKPLQYFFRVECGTAE